MISNQMIRATLVILLLLIVPQIALLLIVVHLVLTLIILSLQFAAAWLPLKKLKKVEIQGQPFVSIHIASYNEPPQMLIDSIAALQNLDYENFEVIVLDNNTKDPAVWQPVAEYCQQLNDPRFKFFHVDNLAGYKSGALNWINQRTDPRTEYVVILDADYEVQPHFLRVALRYFSDDKIGLVQFPQAYKNVSKHNRAMSLEYKHFFGIYMNMANHFDSVTATGTVSIFRRSALEKIGQWSHSCITEDCDVGMRLNLAGLHGIYVPEAISKGLMPIDLPSLRKQRKRWVFGNAQILKSMWREILFAKNLRLSQRVGLITQLTAWFHFTYIPMVTLLVYLGLHIFRGDTLDTVIVLLAASNLAAFYIMKLILFIICFSVRSHYKLSEALKAYLVHVGLSWESATAWMECLVDDNFVFERTNKFTNYTQQLTKFYLNPHVVITVLLSIITLCGIVTNSLLAVTLTLSLIALQWPILFVIQQVRLTSAITSKLYPV